jgi:hypothetical protein
MNLTSEQQKFKESKVAAAITVDLATEILKLVANKTMANQLDLNALPDIAASALSSSINV